MNIVVAIKVVPDSQDILTAQDGSLDVSKAANVISEYDLNAIEAAAQLVEAHEGSVVHAVTVGPAKIDDSKLKKNILARGIDELHMIADDAAGDLDSFATAKMLSSQIEKLGGFDIVICGDGSADNYAQQVDVQLAYLLGAPSVNGVVTLQVEDGVVKATRKLEDAIEEVELSTPCLISVSPEIALPRIPGMRDILKAGKKPMNVAGADGAVANTVKMVEAVAPESAERKLEVANASSEGAIENFAAALKAALQ